MGVIVALVASRVLIVLDGINGGGIPLETGDIAALVSTSISSGDNSIVNAAVIVVVVCWLIGIIDSYRLGITRDKPNV